MILIEVRNSSGVVGRCDAKCYDAEHPYCDCICGGKNHGAGRSQAIENTREYAKVMIKNYTDEKEFKNFEALIDTEGQNRIMWSFHRKLIDAKWDNAFIFLSDFESTDYAVFSEHNRY